MSSFQQVAPLKAVSIGSESLLDPLSELTLRYSVSSRSLLTTSIIRSIFVLSNQLQYLFHYLPNRFVKSSSVGKS
ncbi:MAG: hypothetical protein EZS28_047434 [Streblomastix strix]|uniref:Uncharacterized protein n=1 Tax=Streblomastix strix TaxID=222440 RepID=A0A5J4TFX2_9EUKA|nr:MAG: hypothetical protein EZS28_047434 [Streblomastix strix]